MPKYIFTNRATSLLAAEIGAAATLVGLTTGDGTKFPSPGSDEAFTLFIEGGGNREYMICTSRAGDTLTVSRAASPYSFPVGSKIVHTASAEALNSFRQKGDVRSVTVDPNGTSPRFSNEMVVNQTNGDVWFHISGTTWLQAGAKGSIQVLISPVGAQSLGAWSIDNGSTWRNHATFAIPLSTGQYNIIFKDASGFTKPANIATTVEAFKTSIVVANYT